MKLLIWTSPIRACNNLGIFFWVNMDVFLTHPQMSWRGLIWNKVANPRDRFYMAYGIGEIQNQKRAMRVTSDNLCPLSDATKESIHHIYFECPFDQRCLDEIEK